MPIRAVFFDVGETLVDETRMWGAWVDTLEVPRLTLFGLLGATIAREEHHRQVFDYFGANRLARATERMRTVEPLTPGDFYPGTARRASRLFAPADWFSASRGTSPRCSRGALLSQGVPLDLAGSSRRPGGEAAGRGSLARLVAEAPCSAAGSSTVGEAAAGPRRRVAAFGAEGRRPPGARRTLHARRAEAGRAEGVIQGLTALPEPGGPAR